MPLRYHLRCSKHSIHSLMILGPLFRALRAARRGVLGTAVLCDTRLSCVGAIWRKGLGFFLYLSTSAAHISAVLVSDSILCNVTTHKASGSSNSSHFWIGTEIRHLMWRSSSLRPKELQGGARTVRATGHLDASNKGAHVIFSPFLLCVLVVYGPSKVWDPRQEPLLPRCVGSPGGCGSRWALAFSWGAPSAEGAEGPFLRTLGGAGSGGKEWQMVLWLAGCQNACGLLQVSLAGILEILGGYFLWGLEVLWEQVGLEQELWLIGIGATSFVHVCGAGRAWEGLGDSFPSQ